MRLIHCADLHLDSRMEKDLAPEQAEERGRELCLTFSRMIQYAMEKEVRVILIAGDLFDQERLTKRTLDFVLDSMAGAPDVDFLLLEGSGGLKDSRGEDRLAVRGRELPKNLRLFSDGWRTYRYDTVTVSGIETDGQNRETLYQTLELQEEDINIVMLYGQAGDTPGKGQICIPLLRGRHIDYLALGHAHSARQERLDNRGVWCCSGCLEGREFQECGVKGFVQLETSGSMLRHTFVPFARRQFQEILVDITGRATGTEVLSALQTAAAGVPKESLVRFILRGTASLESRWTVSSLRNALRDRFYFVTFQDETRLETEEAGETGINVDSFRRGDALENEFFRTVWASRLSSEEKRRVLCCGLQALRGGEIVP